MEFSREDYAKYGWLFGSRRWCIYKKMNRVKF
jgi:hypothetical protein